MSRITLKRISGFLNRVKLRVVQHTSFFNVYKYGLGRFLAAGLKLNKFDYPYGIWPPPTPARKYIYDFLTKYKEQIHGRCVEFPPAVYKKDLIKLPSVSSYDVWGLKEGQDITIIGDLQNSPHLKDGIFDTFICTHVLGCIAKPWLAVAEMHRLLAPGGLVLCTVPAILQKIAPDPKDYWRFTYDSLTMLFSGYSKIEIQAYGNAATVAGSPFYLMTHHFPNRVLSKHDPQCPSILTIAAWK